YARDTRNRTSRTCCRRRMPSQWRRQPSARATSGRTARATPWHSASSPRPSGSASRSLPCHHGPEHGRPLVVTHSHQTLHVVESLHGYGSSTLIACLKDRRHGTAIFFQIDTSRTDRRKVVIYTLSYYTLQFRRTLVANLICDL